MVEIIPVHPQDIAIVWPDCEPILQRALDHSEGESNAEGVRRSLEQQQVLLWVIIDKKIIAIAITQVFQYQLKRTLRGLYLAGDRMDEWLPLFRETMMKHAQRFGCKDIELYGRKGWVKKLKTMGFHEGYRMVRCEIAY